ncbi:DciA family protein [Breoghania sp.]|uniref:DUF721 domain-containing protein n=1 Tax=Breoghania sp. TaxID=2065378 RepID=UPI0029CA0F47|nr:DciA family protein [Breoghania sp.]
MSGKDRASGSSTESRYAGQSQGSSPRGRRRPAKPLADLIGGVLEPACRKRGFATADLISLWPDIVGDRYGRTTQPEALHWPRRRDGASDAVPEPATLVIRCDGPSALFLQHELPQMIQRINMFFGWAAVGRIKIVQRPLKRQPERAIPKQRALSDLEEAELKRQLEDVPDTPLRAALDKLGRSIKARRAK